MRPIWELQRARVQSPTCLKATDALYFARHGAPAGGIPAKPFPQNPSIPNASQVGEQRPTRPDEGSFPPITYEFVLLAWCVFCRKLQGKYTGSR
jgi:hypothetical protein